MSFKLFYSQHDAVESYGRKKKAKVIETTFQIFKRSVDTDLTVQTHNPRWRIIN